MGKPEIYFSIQFHCNFMPEKPHQMNACETGLLVAAYLFSAWISLLSL